MFVESVTGLSGPLEAVLSRVDGAATEPRTSAGASSSSNGSVKAGPGAAGGQGVQVQEVRPEVRLCCRLLGCEDAWDM